MRIVLLDSAYNFKIWNVILFQMSLCRFLRPAGRVVRITRGFLILLSALAIFGTIAFIHRMETSSKFSSEGPSIVVIKLWDSPKITAHDLYYFLPRRTLSTA